MKRTARTLCALSLLLAAVAPAGSLKRIEPIDIVDLREVTDPQISPDGKLIVYSVLRRLSGAEHDDASVWLVPADGSKPERPLVIGEGESGSARWAPDSRRVAFLSSRANPLNVGKRSRQLWLLSLDGGEAQPLTKVDGDIADFRWSPDGQRIAFLASDPVPADVRARVALRQDSIQVDANPQMQRVWIYDLRSRSAEQVTPANIHVSMLAWSPDGARLALRTAQTPDINAHWYRSDLAIFDLAEKRLNPPIAKRAAAVTPAWSPDGQQLAFSEILEDGIGAEPRIYDFRSLKVTSCGENYPGLIGEMRWNSDGRGLLIHKFENTRTGFATLDARSCEIKHVVDAFHVGPYGLSASADGKAITYVGSTFHQPPEVWDVGQDTEGGDQDQSSNAIVAARRCA